MRRALLYAVSVAALAACAHAASAPQAPAEPSEPRLAEGDWGVGPAHDIHKLIQAQMPAGSRTGCEEPPPTAEERASWKPGGGTPDGLLSFSGVLALGDDAMTREVGSRLVDKAYGPGYAAMSEPEKSVYLLWNLSGEVENGGLDQYFFNSAGNCALQASSALDRVGLVQEGAVFRRVLAAFPGGKASEDRRTRMAQLDGIDEATKTSWNRLDEAFYQLSSSAEAARYIRKNAASFELPACNGPNCDTSRVARMMTELLKKLDASAPRSAAP